MPSCPDEPVLIPACAALAAPGASPGSHRANACDPRECPDGLLVAAIQKMSARRHWIGVDLVFGDYDCSSCWMRSRRVLMMSSLLTSERRNRMFRKNLLSVGLKRNRNP